MMELTIYGRGGQGGVTLAKLLASAWFQRGQFVQAFGVYAAERSGAPLQAYVRMDEREITTHNQIRRPDHVIVIDRTLISPGILTGLKAGGILILNTSDAPEALAEIFPGRRVACIDATTIAAAHRLGTRAVPIVNTTMLGAVARTLGLEFTDVEAALAEAKFGGANVAAAREAFERVTLAELPGSCTVLQAPLSSDSHVSGILDPDVGQPPTIRTGAWANRLPHRRMLTSPCNHVCPAGNDVQGFIAAMARGDTDEALEILLRSSPLPATCGRVCPAPCMGSCNRATFDEPVNVRELERYAGDHGHHPPPTSPHRGERVAVVGSGPAGLSAAYHLARLGYPVTIIEAQDELGGLLRSGIPAYRLPPDVLDREISHILRHGVSVKRSHAINRRELLRLTTSHDAVFVGTGLQTLHSVNLGGDSDTDGTVVQGIEFLQRCHNSDMRLDGESVVVIGGGNTALDAARTAQRIGAASVRILYRRTRAEMPAIAEEIDEALAEKIALDELVMPLYLQRCDRGGALLTCTRMVLTEPDESGRRKPVPDVAEDAQFAIKCDRVILALGQAADLSILPEGCAVHEDGQILGLTAAPVFAGGDFATNDGTVAAAIGAGRRAALAIHKTLSGEDLTSRAPEEVAGPEYVTTHFFTQTPQHRGRELPASLRRHSFIEVRRGFAEDQRGLGTAVAEAARCFSCGVCNQCDRCVNWCPEGILRRDGDGYKFDYDYCKGCGICAEQCPRGVIYMAEL